MKSVVVFLCTLAAAGVSGSGAIPFAISDRIAVTDARGLSVADLDGDGRAEIIVANGGAHTVEIYSRDGVHYRLARSLHLDATPQATHINRASTPPHIMVATSAPDTLTVFSPTKDGGYSPWTAAVGSGARRVTIRTSALPHIKDAMVVSTGGAGSESMSIFESCYGCKCEMHTIPAGRQPYDAAAGDFDRDGSEEIAVANYGSSDVTLIHRDATLGFVPGETVAVGSKPVAIASADFDRDGNLDLMTADGGSSTATALYGDGVGNFTARKTALAAAPTDLDAADLNRDGAIDAVVSTVRGVDVLMNRATKFERFSLLLTPASEVVAADIDGDGDSDVVLLSASGKEVLVLTF